MIGVLQLVLIIIEPPGIPTYISRTFEVGIGLQILVEITHLTGEGSGHLDWQYS